MKQLIKNQVVFFLILSLLAVPAFANPTYKNKLSVQNISDPPEWVGEFSLGSLLQKMVHGALLRDDKFQLVASSHTAKPPIAVKPSKDPSIQGTSGLNHPVQYDIRVKILSFEMLEPTGPIQKMFDQAGNLLQSQELIVEIDLISHHTNRLVANKIFKAKIRSGGPSSDWSEIFLNPESAEFQKSPLGAALKSLTSNIIAFVNRNLFSRPLDGETVLVHLERDEVLINLGWLNGVQPGDFFDVFAIELKFKDPFSHADLGDKYMRRGVLKVKEVRERYSVTEIVAGTDFKAGDLARCRSSNSPLVNEASSNPPGKRVG
jgi:hypothetical protein